MRLIVTGTDTGVGKTLVSCCFGAALRGRIRACKPVASGVPIGQESEDARLIARAAGHEPLGLLRMVAPISPHRAALDEGIDVDPRAVRAWIESLGHALIEGAGGWRSPMAFVGGSAVFLNELCPRADVVLVAADRLGVLNAAILSAEAIARDGRRLVGVVLNRGVGDPSDPARGSNADELRRLLGVPVATIGAVGADDLEAQAVAGRALLHTFLMSAWYREVPGEK